MKKLRAENDAPNTAQLLRADDDYKSERLDFLEDSGRKQLLSLDLLDELVEIHRRARQPLDSAQTLLSIQRCLTPLFNIEHSALFLVGNDASFKCAVELPQGRTTLQEQADKLIANGDFAWAINHNGPQLFDGKTSSQKVLINVVATSKEVLGMFIAILVGPVRLDDFARKIIAIALNNCAYAIENANLYQVLREQRDEMEMMLKKRTQELEFTTQHDQLTGLHNRTELLSDLESFVRSKSVDSFALIHLGVEGLGRVNDVYGYKSGDRLLVEIGKRIQRFFKKVCRHKQSGMIFEDLTLARQGAGQFTVLIPNKGMGDIPVLEKQLQELLEILNGNYNISKQKVRVVFRAGVSMYPDNGVSAKSLLSRAEVALHHARRVSNAKLLFFSDDLSDLRQSDKLPLEAELQHAIGNDELFVCYQPKIDLLSEEIVGAEALLRWRHPERGLVPPDEFIPVAESSGLIEPIGEWVLRRVCQQLRSWQASGMVMRRFSVNLSQIQIQQRDLVEIFAKILDSESVSPDWLEFELTETSLMHDVDAATRVLTDLHDLGFHVSIDDFGTGHSSLTLLKQFPLDTIKIDRSFIRDLNSDPDDAAIVNAVVTMGHNLRMRVVAEGVETSEQLHFLRSMGCHEVQGYFTGRPIPADEFFVLQRDWQGL